MACGFQRSTHPLDPAGNAERWYDLQQEQLDNPSAEFVTWTGDTRNDGPIGVQTRGYPQLTSAEMGTQTVVSSAMTSLPIRLAWPRP